MIDHFWAIGSGVIANPFGEYLTLGNQSISWGNPQQPSRISFSCNPKFDCPVGRPFDFLGADFIYHPFPQASPLISVDFLWSMRITKPVGFSVVIPIRFKINQTTSPTIEYDAISPVIVFDELLFPFRIQRYVFQADAASRQPGTEFHFPGRVVKV
jgi:hypothetical protein